MRPVVLALALVVAGCSTPHGGGDGGAGSGGTLDLAPAGPLDMTPRPTNGLIGCGANNCTALQQLCCTDDSGVTGTCQLVSNPSCGAAEFTCDGPEDCPLAMHECCVESGFAGCYTPGYCAMRAMTVSAFVMCHNTVDCPSGWSCVAAPNGSPYSLCILQ